MIGKLFFCGAFFLGATASHAVAREGLASWYGEAYRGQPMANGQPFDPDALTAASWDYPLGAVLRVTAGPGVSVDVVVTDRGPARHLVAGGRIIDLSAGAFWRLADTRRGLVHVWVEPLPMEGKK